MKRFFSQTIRNHPKNQAQVCIVGSGPVGMTLANVLNKFKISNILLEKTPGLQQHPKAHYLSFRTCEILNDIGMKEGLEKRLQVVDQWCKFKYATHVMSGKLIADIDHFNYKNEKVEGPEFYQQKFKEFQRDFTYSYPNHYSQDKADADLMHLLNEQNQQIRFGNEYQSHQVDPDLKEGWINVQVKNTQQNELYDIKCDYLVGTDGLGSMVRKNIGVELEGKTDYLNFINVYFSSPSLGKKMLMQNNTGMLYWIYNGDVVGILICHDIKEGEFVLQIPYYPPTQDITDFQIHPEKAIELVKETLFANDHVAKEIDIKLKDVSGWRMGGLVAASYVSKNPSGLRPHTFLAGDAAHAFPPAGGFGMNTGVGDAYSLAHKLQYAIENKDNLSQGQLTQFLNSYDLERRYTGQITRSCALNNYEKGIKIAEMMHMHYSHAVMFQNLTSKLPICDKQVFNLGLKIGLKTVDYTNFILNSHSRVKEYIKKDPKNSIRQLFPNLDFSYSYPSLNQDKDKSKHKFFMKQYYDSMNSEPYSEIGSLVQHLKFVQPIGPVFALRQYFADQCFKKQKSLFFITVCSNAKPDYSKIQQQLETIFQDPILGQYKIGESNAQIIKCDKSGSDKMKDFKLKDKVEQVSIEIVDEDLTKYINNFKGKKELSEGECFIQVYRGDGHLIYSQ